MLLVVQLKMPGGSPGEELQRSSRSLAQVVQARNLLQGPRGAKSGKTSTKGLERLPPSEPVVLQWSFALWQQPWRGRDDNDAGSLQSHLQMLGV